jgi:hypothetical protein
LAYAYDFEQAAMGRVPPKLIEDRKVLPSQVFAIEDGQTNVPRDGLGDLITNVAAMVNTSVGETDSSGATNRERRVILRFDLPDSPSADLQLDTATLRVRLERQTGNVATTVGVFHSVSDNSSDQLKTYFEDSSFVDTGLDITAPPRARMQLFDLDVTEIVRQDYALDGPAGKSSIRLQIREELVDDDSSNRYFLTMPGGGLFPELTLYFALPGDYDKDGALSVIDIEMLSTAIRAGNQSARFDLNHDQRVDSADHSFWVVRLKKAWFGDANLDLNFDTGDLVQIFQAGQYEDDVVANSTWATGDWNADGEFTSSDLVVAFQDGGYEQGPRVGIAAVPEPSSYLLVIAAAVGLFCNRRSSRSKSPAPFDIRRDSFANGAPSN